MSYQFTYNTRQAVYLLDRNIISLIRNVNSGKLPTDDNKKLMLEQLKDKDKKENLFSPMTSIAEGNQKRIMNEEEFRTVIDNDAAAIESFFQYARTDSKILNGMIEALCCLPNGLNETPYAAYVDFLKAVSPRIVDKIAVNWREPVRDLIIEAALSRGIVPSHPVVMCCLSILYGSDVSRRVLKPSQSLKNDEWHNALSDIQIVSRLGQFIAIGPNIEFIFLTMDKGLREFLDFFTITGAHSSAIDPTSQNVLTTITTDIKFEMFPDLSESLIIDLKKLLLNAAIQLKNNQDGK